jgi:hypothetical protein
VVGDGTGGEVIDDDPAVDCVAAGMMAVDEGVEAWRTCETSECKMACTTPTTARESLLQRCSSLERGDGEEGGAGRGDGEEEGSG